MPDHFVELSLSAQTAYAELLEQTETLNLQSLTGITGTFHRRILKGREYVYFVYSDPIGKTQHRVYVGPANPRIDALVEKFVSNNAPKKLSPNSRAAIALGCTGIFPKHYRILRQLSAYGFFKAGGVLIGTHAFVTMANVLGVRWTGSAQTQDIDFADAGRNVSIALPTDVQLSVHDALTSLEMGLLPIQELTGGIGGQYRSQKDPELRVDFLTPLTRRKGPVAVKELGLQLEPIKFMEYLLEGTQQAAAFSQEGSCLVNIPAPERLAVHKLIVAAERQSSNRVKANKDLSQAAALIEWHLETEQTKAINDAWLDAVRRGPGWRARARKGFQALKKKYPDTSWPAWST